MAKRISQFDIRKIPKEILERNHVSYSPYRLNASCNSRLQIDKDGKFNCTPIEGNLDDAIADITSTFPIDREHQVIKTSGPNGQFVSLLIAAVGGNFEIIHKSMAQYNLFPSINPIGIIVPDGEHDWLDVRFYPAGYDITNLGAEGGLKPLLGIDISQIDIYILRQYYKNNKQLTDNEKE